MRTWISLLLTMALLGAIDAQASNTRILDGAQITNGAATLTLPTTSDTITGRATTDTLTNKSLSGGSNTFTNIPAATAISGTLPKANGGTAQDNSSLTFPASGTVPAITPTNHGVVISGSGASASVTSAGTATQVLTSNGASADPTFQAVPSAAPSLNGSSGTPQSVTAAGGITLASISYSNYVFVAGSPGAVTVSATPSITAGTAAGQKLTIIATSATNTVTLQDVAGLAGSALRLNGNWLGSKYSIIELVWDSDASEWDEVARR